MKYLGTILLLAATACAQANIPSCALLCAVTAAQVAACTVSESSCYCNSATFQTSWNTCMATSCSTGDRQSAVTINQQRCAAVGVTLSGYSASSVVAASSAASSVVSSAASAATTASSAISSASSASATASSGSSASAATSLAISASVTSSTVAPTATTGSDQESSGQSSSGKTIGIAVGVAVGVAVILGLVGWFFFRRFALIKRPQSDTEQGSVSSLSPLDEKMSVRDEAKLIYLTKQAQEVDAKHLVEMEHPRDNYAMLDGSESDRKVKPMAELEGSDVKRPKTCD